jgi:hypothetical protein
MLLRNYVTMMHGQQNIKLQSMLNYLIFRLMWSRARQVASQHFLMSLTLTFTLTLLRRTTCKDVAQRAL